METPFYRLKELIIKKYGEDKFLTGCALVAWWLQHITKKEHTAAVIRTMCRLAPTDVPWYYQLEQLQAEALVQLFKLESYKELYTLPETAPHFPELNQ